MGDETVEKFHQKLFETREELRKQRDRLQKAEERVKELENQQRVIVEALQLIGEEVPATDQVDWFIQTGRPARAKRLRAIDAALMVTKPGEVVTKQQIADKVSESEIDFHSANLANALWTAMTRSDQFERTGRPSEFRRVSNREDGSETEIRRDKSASWLGHSQEE